MNSHDSEAVKSKLKKYMKKDIIFNEPHFTRQMLLREGNKEQVIFNLLNPEKLVYCEIQDNRSENKVCCLYFKISNTRTMKLPVIFDKEGRKSLYILTYIMRYRNWKGMIR